MMKLKHWAAVLLVATTSFALAGCGQPKTSHHSAAKTTQVKPKQKKQSVVGYYLNSKDEVAMHFKKNGRGRYLKLYYQACPADVKFTWKKTGKNTYDLHYDSDFQGKARLVDNKLVLQTDGDKKNISLKKTKPFNLTDWMQRESLKSGPSSSQNSDSSSSSSDGSGKYGNEGAFNIPAEMQGTWYSSDGSIALHGNTITTSDSDCKIYRQSRSFANSDQMMDDSVADATRGWLSGTIYDSQGMHWLNLRGWAQTAGAGTSYAVHTENIDGKNVKVLVVAGGAENWVLGTYFETQDLADQYGDQQFDDLNYE